jgi:hypothetical protein
MDFHTLARLKKTYGNAIVAFCEAKGGEFSSVYHEMFLDSYLSTHSLAIEYIETVAAELGIELTERVHNQVDLDNLAFNLMRVNVLQIIRKARPNPAENEYYFFKGSEYSVEAIKNAILEAIADVYPAEEMKTATAPETETTTAPAKVERVRVKLYFDSNNICLGGCCDDSWLPLYTGEEYVASEFFKLTPGFNPVGKSVKELQQIERDSNPYKIAATATAVALEAKLTAEKTARSVAAIEAMGLETQEANKLAETAKKYPELAKIKIDYPSLDISELEEAFNNNEILEIKQIQKGSVPIFLVLRVWGKNEWVTHHYNAANNGFSLGWYFKDLQKAQANYRKRKRGECSPLGPVTR